MRPRIAPTVSLPCPYHAIYERGDVAFEVPLENCSSLLHFSYALSGWHPFTQTLLQYEQDSRLSYETSVLKAFYETYQPKTILEAYLGHSNSEHFQDSKFAKLGTTAYHPFFPWDATIRTAKGEHGLDATHGHQAFGPVSVAKGKMEFQRLIDTYESVKESGYVPQTGYDGDIRGFFLRTASDYRFVVRQGLHRTPALSVLGYQTVRAKFFKGLPRVIFLSDSRHWPQVRSGLMSKALAERIFRLFFEENGTKKAESIGPLASDTAATSSLWRKVG